MKTPTIYIVAKEIGTAYWIEGGAVVGAPIQVDGTPDWENSFDAQATDGQTSLIAQGLEAMLKLQEWIASNA